MNKNSPKNKRWGSGFWDSKN